ncbi:hypothetical protein [Paenisporosarcina cavernae]|uniref:Sporulation protein n=1 Tax=Paenisporosarcina cavernae TaxID=2320858 RepID=A0A385YTZ2_9BACL|nr:hypothetical protein [Paenisporosarcina cavernae]AYC29032.1 hypothetical protein D3873_03765 [Paenisporosarcina cavernae]
MKRIVVFFMCCIVLSGCSSDLAINLFDASKSTDETAIRSIFEEEDSLESVDIVFYDHTVVAAVEVNPWKKYKKAKLEKKYQKKLEKMLPEHEVLVSADLKIRWELEKVLNHPGKATVEKLSKSLDRIQRLSKEET